MTKRAGVGAGAVLLATLAIAYPVLIYWGLSRFDVRYLALVLLVVYLVKLASHTGTGGGRSRGVGFLTALLAVGLFGAALVLDNAWFLLIYPVLVNAAMLGVFAASLRNGLPMIERFARMREPDLPDVAVAYCRRVTLVWCGFFVVNGCIAAWTVWFGSMAQWTLYNGLISYVLMGLLFAVEGIVRFYFKRRHGG